MSERWTQHHKIELLYVSAGVLLFVVWFLYSYGGLFMGRLFMQNIKTPNNNAVRRDAARTLSEALEKSPAGYENTAVRQKASQDLSKKLNTVPGDSASRAAASEKLKNALQ